ncbi:MAG TPA: cytochrome c oxidase subunit 4 [Actinocrinis sp.]
MKTTAHLFGILAVFLAVDLIIYWFASYDPTGTAALFMATCMSGMISFYLWFTANRIETGPDDRKDGEPYEGAGEQGFFSPHSWWPFTMALGAAGMFTGIAVGFWLCYFAAPFFAYGVYGLVFEYYRGENKRY